LELIRNTGEFFSRVFGSDEKKRQEFLKRLKRKKRK